MKKKIGILIAVFCLVANFAQASLWDWISDQTLNAVGFWVDAQANTAQWFQNLGNAVAMGLGGFFHNLVDFYVILVFIGQYIFQLFQNLLSPVLYIFHYLSGIWSGLVGGVSYETPISFGADILSFFALIPGFQILITAIGGLICVIAVITSIKILSS